MKASTRLRAGAIALVIAMALPGVARAIRPAPPAEKQAPPPQASSVDQLLEVLHGTGSADARNAAVAELTKLGNDAVPALKKFMNRKRATDVAARRAVLVRIGASIPDKSGKFHNPGRSTSDQRKKDDEVDWLAELLALDARKPAVADVVADVAVVRALAGMPSVNAGDLIFRVAFSDDTMIYRDECGRQLRKMAPYSLPALIRRASITRKYSSARRYATYQLERMDLESPKKAVRSSAGDERLEATLLWTYGDAGFRQAVAEVLAHTNDDSPAIRAAARKGWNAYITGTPPEAPKRKLSLPGGKTTDKEQPLYLNYKELADIELRNTYEQVLGEAPKRRAKLKEMTKALFDHWDQERAAAAGKLVNVALQKADGGDLAGAVHDLDQILAQEETTDRGPKVAAVYFRRAGELEKAKEWRAAARAYGKAQALDPKGDNATDAMAGHYYTLAQAVKSEGGDATALLAKAAALQPKAKSGGNSHPGRAMPGDDGGSPTWMLYAGAAGALAALLLLVLGLRMRRHSAA